MLLNPNNYLTFTLKFIYYKVIDFLMIFTITVLVCVQIVLDTPIPVLFAINM